MASRSGVEMQRRIQARRSARGELPPATGATRVAASVTAALLGFAASHDVHAGDWKVTPQVQVEAVYDDNYTLAETKEEEIEAVGAVLDADVTFGWENPNSHVRFTPQVRTSAFPDDSFLNSTDYFGSFDAERQGTRSKVGFALDYAHEVLVKDYLPTSGIDSGLGNPRSGDDVTRLDANAERDLFRVAPTLTYDLTDRSVVDIGIEYLDANYTSGTRENYTDYTNLSGSVAYGYRWTESSRIYLRALGSQYKPDGTDIDSTDTYGLQAEWAYEVSQTARAYVRVGTERSEIKSNVPGVDDETQSTFSGGAGVRWAYEVTDIFLDVDSGVDPNPVGTVVEREQVRFRVEHRFSERMAAFAGVRGVRDRPIGEREGEDVDYVAASTGLVWRLKPALAIVGAYEYTSRSTSKVEGDTDANSNAVRLSLIFDPARIGSRTFGFGGY